MELLLSKRLFVLPLVPAHRLCPPTQISPPLASLWVRLPWSPVFFAHGLYGFPLAPRYYFFFFFFGPLSEKPCLCHFWIPSPVPATFSSKRIMAPSAVYLFRNRTNIPVPFLSLADFTSLLCYGYFLPPNVAAPQITLLIDRIQAFRT